MAAVEHGVDSRTARRWGRRHRNGARGPMSDSMRHRGGAASASVTEGAESTGNGCPPSMRWPSGCPAGRPARSTPPAPARCSTVRAMRARQPARRRSRRSLPRPCSQQTSWWSSQPTDGSTQRPPVAPCRRWPTPAACHSKRRRSTSMRARSTSSGLLELPPVVACRDRVAPSAPSRRRRSDLAVAAHARRDRVRTCVRRRRDRPHDPRRRRTCPRWWQTAPNRRRQVGRADGPRRPPR